MNLQNLHLLASLIRQHSDSLLARWREQVRQLPSARHLDIPTLNDHVPDLLKEMAEALIARSDASIPEMLREGSPPAHGLQRLTDGYDIEEVVAEYNILRGCIHDLADRNALSLQGAPFHVLNRVLDGAIGLAVQTYAAEQALQVQLRRDEYLAFVAHDLRTPLNAISLSARVLESSLSRPLPANDSARVLKALHRNVRQLDELLSKIVEENANLDAESGVKLQRRQFDLWPLVESLVFELGSVAAHSRTRLLNEVPDELTVYADAGHLKRVFQNLIHNAIRYAPDGTVTIRAERVDSGAAVECSVSDDGTGIAAPLLDKIFEKGESDLEHAEGSGLGLAIVKQLIEAHDGVVTVSSIEGQGACFRFSLPNREPAQ
jgi:two-component system, OmpR family, phosphate regulon sensor histidine kinase PhoR